LKQDALLLIAGDIFFILWLLLEKVQITKKLIASILVAMVWLAVMLELEHKNPFLAPLLLLKMMGEMGLALKSVLVRVMVTLGTLYRDI
jgi:hypothetical protein